jgi:hypothetical protein
MEARGTSQMGLYRTLKDNLNVHDNSIEQIAIEAFEKAMPIPEWVPNNRFWGDGMWIIRIGILAHVLRNAPSADGKIQALVKDACKGLFDPDIEAELHAATLGISLCHSISLVKEGGQRTPDLLSICDGQCIDWEVCRSQAKVGKKQLLDLVQLFNAAIGLTNDHNIGVFLNGYPTPKEQDQVLESVISSQPGQRSEEVGRWAVVGCGAGEREAFIGGPGHELLKPRWWPEEEATIFRGG